MRLSLILFVAMTACTNSLPDTLQTASTTAQNAPFPPLVPVENLFETAQSSSTIEADTNDLQSRAARLRQKADALRGRTIIDGQDRIKRLNLS